MEKKILKRILVSLFLTFSLTSHVSATLITDLYGDKDGFGIGVADGASFDFNAVIADDVADLGTITDTWMTGTRTWSHTYDLSGLGPILSADLEVFTGGTGQSGASSLFLDDILVGTITIGQSAPNIARLDTYDLISVIDPSLLDGANSLRIQTTVQTDAWVLDYSELTITTASVPEPAVISFLAMGLLGIAISRRNCNRKFS